MTSTAKAPSEKIAADLSTLFHRVMADGDLLRFIDEVDLSLSQFKTLGMLRESEDELTLKEVAEQMGLSLPAASRAVDGMCQRGYVERREDEVDRRMKRVRIAPAGAEVMDRIKSARIDVIARFLETLPAEDLDRLAKAIAPVLQRAEADR